MAAIPDTTSDIIPLRRKERPLDKGKSKSDHRAGIQRTVLLQPTCDECRGSVLLLLERNALTMRFTATHSVQIYICYSSSCKEARESREHLVPRQTIQQKDDKVHRIRHEVGANSNRDSMNRREELRILIQDVGLKGTDELGHEQRIFGIILFTGSGPAQWAFFCQSSLEAAWFHVQPRKSISRLVDFTTSRSLLLPHEKSVCGRSTRWTERMKSIQSIFWYQIV